MSIFLYLLISFSYASEFLESFCLTALLSLLYSFFPPRFLKVYFLSKYSGITMLC